MPAEMQGGNPTGDIYLIAMPMTTYQQLSDLAAQRNLSFAQALGKAIEEFLGKPTEQAPVGPRLLVENKE
jgi:hypothetical protein